VIFEFGVYVCFPNFDLNCLHEISTYFGFWMKIESCGGERLLKDQLVTTNFVIFYFIFLILLILFIFV